MILNDVLKGIRTGVTVVRSDSRAPIRALRYPVINPKMVWDDKNLGKRNKVNVLWVSGSVGLQESETANELVREMQSLQLLGLNFSEAWET